MPIPIALSDIRAAILKSRRMSFTYEHEEVVADFYMLGQAKKTGAYVVMGWCVEPVQGWRLFRYSLIKNLEAIGGVSVDLRSDFNPYHPKISVIDTVAYHVQRTAH